VRNILHGFGVAYKFELLARVKHEKSLGEEEPVWQIGLKSLTLDHWYDE
jgi:hypothetical protein